MIGVVLMNSIYSCLMIEAVIFIFKYKLSLKGGVQIFLLPLLQYMFSYYMLHKYNSNGLRDDIVFIFCCCLECAVLIIITLMIEYENIYLAILILILYTVSANLIMVGVSSLSGILSQAQCEYVLYRGKVSAVPAMLVIVVVIISGYICSKIFAVIYSKLKGKHEDTYKIVVIFVVTLFLVSSVIRHKYFNVMAVDSSTKNTTHVAVMSIISFAIIFLAINVIIYVYNRFELKRLLTESRETGKWITDLQKQYLDVSMSNHRMQQVLVDGLKETDIAHKALEHDISLTGNIMLDTLFAYYSQMAKEKDIVFEIQSELANGDRIKCDNYYISAGTEIVNEISDNEAENVNQNESENVSKGKNGNPDRNMGRNKSTELAADETAKIMKKIDMVTISDRVLSVYFDKAENEKGYVFVNLKLGGGKLMLDYEMNKELGIDRLSFGVCRKYKRLRAVRRIVRIKNGVASCETKEGRQRISVMFVGKEV